MVDKATWKIDRDVHNRTIQLQPNGVERSYFITQLLDLYEEHEADTE